MYNGVDGTVWKLASNIIRYLRACGTNMLICVRTVNTGVSHFEIILTSALIIIAPHSALISANALITNFIINQINQPTSDYQFTSSDLTVASIHVSVKSQFIRSICSKRF